MSDSADDFEALFDEVSAQRSAAIATAAPAIAAVSASAEKSQDGKSDIQVDKPMFDRLGGIVRQLHDSLRELGYDRSLADIAVQVNDSQGRLEYIATLTEQAANKVLNAIDAGLPAQESLSKQAKDIDSRWSQLFDGKLGIEEFKSLAGDSRQFATTVTEVADAERSRLMEIMMAQDFQDITGQIIKKVVAITQKLEQELAQLLRDNAPAVVAVKDRPVDLMAGPDVPASAMGQDDVDDLLADLGF